MTDLFRPEALEGQRLAWLGSIQLIRAPSLTVLTVLVVAATAAVIGFLMLGEYTRKARVNGYLVPDRGVIRLLAPRASTVIESHVGEGKAVEQGDVLFVLSVEQPTLEGASQQAVKSSLAARERSLMLASRQQQQLEQSRLAALDQQIEQMRSEQRQMAAEAEVQGQRLRLALQAQARIESLRGDNFVSSAQVQAKAEEVLAIRAQLLNIERQHTVHAREIGNLQARRRELPMQGQSAQGEIERDLAALSQQMAENEAGRRIVLRAPQDGVITGVLSALGQSVGDGAPLASLLPAQAKLQAHLFAPSSAVGFLRADQPVLLRYEAFPYQKFGHQRGTVLQVSRSPLPAGDVVGLALPATEARSAEPRYRITVALERQTVAAESEAYPLAPGMQLDADVQLDRRRLIEWLFEPLLGMAGRL